MLNINVDHFRRQLSVQLRSKQIVRHNVQPERVSPSAGICILTGASGVDDHPSAASTVTILLLRMRYITTRQSELPA